MRAADQLTAWGIYKLRCENMGCFREFRVQAGKRYCSRRCARKGARRARERRYAVARLRAEDRQNRL